MSAPNATSPDDVLRACGLLTLSEDPPVEAVESALRALAPHMVGADDLRREALREGAMRALKAAGVSRPGKMLDAALAPDEGAADDRQGRVVLLADPDPWPEPVDGATLLDDLAVAFRRYVALPDGGDVLLPLWTVLAHAHDTAYVSPVLALTSPQKRAGKTTALTVLSAVVRKPLPAANITPASLFRGVERWGPTLLVDEADTFLGEREELRGILNSGHTRGTAMVIRTVGDDHEPRVFSTWCPKAIALIGDLPSTLHDRAVVLRMRRRRNEEPVDRLRLDHLGRLEPMRRRAWRWAQDHAAELAEADPAVPEGLHDRAADCWRPLLAIADAAGGPWPGRARAAALILSARAEDDDDDPGVMLLEDLRDLFRDQKADRLASGQVIEHLRELEHRPWPEWVRGRPITARGVAKLLKPYGIAPKPMRITGYTVTKRGYDRDMFEDAWGRYVRNVTPTAPDDVTPESVGAHHVTEDVTPVTRVTSPKREGETPPLADMFEDLPLKRGAR